MNYWAFVANPRRYRIEAAVRERAEDTWRVLDKDVKLGDLVLIWKAKGGQPTRGVVALGEVTSNPHDVDDTQNPYWTARAMAAGPDRRVTVKYHIPPGLPLWEPHPVLERLAVSKARGGSIFSLTQEDWNSVTALLGKWPGPPRPWIKSAQEAVALWPMLLERARAGSKPQPITYLEMARFLQKPIGNWVRFPLELIQAYCESNGLPRLTSMVVDDEGQAGLGFHGDRREPNQEWLAVRTFEGWPSATPTAQDFLALRGDPGGVAGPWTPDEVTVLVKSYMAMLREEQRGGNPNKAENRRGLMAALPSRSHGSIEYKLQNVSAVLEESGLGWIRGYKPARNYQALLAEVVTQVIAAEPALDPEFGQTPMVEASFPTAGAELATVFEAPPKPRPPSRKRLGAVVAARIDFAARETRNRKLGLKGEQFVLALEKKRLVAAGRLDLADMVRHVSAIDGDGLGYDVASFTAQGEPVFVEVKTTTQGAQTPFFMSAAEMAFARNCPGHYRLSRVYMKFDGPHIFELGQAEVAKLNAEPSHFRCWV